MTKSGLVALKGEKKRGYITVGERCWLEDMNL